MAFFGAGRKRSCKIVCTKRGHHCRIVSHHCEAYHLQLYLHEVQPRSFVSARGGMMLSYCALYYCIKIPTIFQYSPQKSSGKGSLLLPCPKMPIGIFLFALKSEFQKSEENGGKRRKPEKISGFSVGIFFVNSSWRRHPKYSPLANISHLAVGRQATAALRWRCELAPPRFAGRSHFKKTSDLQIKKHPRGVLFDLAVMVLKDDALLL